MQSIISKIKSSDTSIQFQDIIAVIDENYDFTPSRFTNGATINETGQNSGSCKVFSFAKLNGFNASETLICFGQYYQDVLKTPQGTDHQNIRNFMKYGWEGIKFDTNALTSRS